MQPNYGQLISVLAIAPSVHQERTVFDEESIRGLADSIREVGLLQPILVREKTVTESHTSLYELVAGERRLRAHKELGLPEIKAIVLPATDAQAAIMGLAENLVREDLPDYDISVALHKVESEFQNRTNMAAALGMNRKKLYRYLVYENLPAFILDDLKKDSTLLTKGSAYEINTTLKKHGERAIDILRELWLEVKTGSLSATKIADEIEAALKRKIVQRIHPQVEQLFVKATAVGWVEKKVKILTINIMTTALSDEQCALVVQSVRATLDSQAMQMGPTSSFAPDESKSEAQ